MKDGSIADTAPTNGASPEPTTKAPAIVAGGTIQPASPAEREFVTYADTRDEFLSTPFAHNTSLAKSGAAFTIEKIATRMVPPNEINQRTEDFEAVVLLVSLQDDYGHVDRQSGEVLTFEAGSRLVISLELNAIREGDRRQIETILQRYGEIANMKLQEYPSKDRMRSNPVGIVHASRWKTLAEIAKERGLVKA